MPFNIIAFIESYGALPYDDNNYWMNCPICNKDKHHFQVSINSDNKTAHCFKCGYRTSWTGLVSKLKRISYAEAQEIVEVFVFSKPKQKKEETKFISFPVSSQWTDDSWEYIVQRGLTEEDVRELGIYFCNYGFYKGRIVMPITLYHKQQAFQARSINGGEPRYLSKGNIGKFLYGYDQIEYGTKKIYIVEGVFKQLSVSKAGFPVVASFTKAVSESQIVLLQGLGIDEVNIMFDGDKEGFEAAIQYYRILSNKFKKVFLVPVDKDPDECTKEEIWNVIDQKADNIEDFRIMRMERKNLTLESNCDII